MIKENKIFYKVKGRYALFTDPITKIGGEKCTLMVPTYQALKGITESIYWKPSIIWYIDRVRIMNRIKTESKGIRTIGYGLEKKSLSFYMYLSDVEYQVEAHFEWNENRRKDLEADFNENKHFFIANRCIEKGGRRDIFLGVRECQGYVEPIKSLKEGKSYYDDKGDMEYGVQYHSISYPDENSKSEMIVNLWNPLMKDGIIEFCRPEDCKYRRTIGEKRSIKTFSNNDNFSGIKEKNLYIEKG